MVDVADVASPETTEPVDFEAFVAADVGSLTDGELVESLLVAQRMRARLDAAAIALVDRFDARTVWAADGDRSAAGWISARAGIAFGQAKSEARIARDLRRHDHITAAARAGRLTTAQVKALLGARRPGLEEAFDLCEELLVDGMTSFTLAAGHRFLARWVQSTRERLGINEPDGAEPDGGETVANAVAAQIDAMWRANVFTTDDGLTSAERRVDALVELIRRGTRSGPDDGTATPPRPRPHQRRQPDPPAHRCGRRRGDGRWRDGGQPRHHGLRRPQRRAQRRRGHRLVLQRRGRSQPVLRRSA
ncbi:MAG: DUF222 domain-containing protein [Iamia sp.]